MSIKAKIEAIIYAAEDPVTFEQVFALVKEDARLELEQLRQQTEAASETEPVIVPVESATEPLPAETVAAESSASESAEPVEPQAEPSVEAEAGQQENEPVENAAPEAPDSAPEQQGEAEPQPITDAEVKSSLRAAIEELISDYNSPERGIEVRQIAGGYRMATKPEQHDVVRAFAKSLKPPIRLSLAALETLAVIAYKQPITAPEISEVRGVDAAGVLGTLLARKFITTAGRKQVIGRPMLYKTTKEFLLRFGLKDVGELPSMEEFEKLAAESLGDDLFAEPEGPSEHPAEQGTVPESPSEEVPAETEGAQASEAQPAVDESQPAQEANSDDQPQPAAEGASDEVASTDECASAEQNPAEAGAPAEEAVPQDESAS